jgi:starch-binding outer membrane protein, SusD/RagB family
MRTVTRLRARSFGRRASITASILVLSACSSVTDSLLEATDPDIINPGDTRSSEGALGLANGALDSFRAITAGSESTWLFGGLLADEWSTSSTFPQNDQTDQRRIEENNSQVTAMLYRLYRSRIRASEAIRALAEFRPEDRVKRAEMYFARGFTEMQLAQDFCNGIPLSELVDGVGTDGTPLSVAEVFQKAIASYDSALVFANGTDATSVSLARAARIGKARAQLGVNQIQEAATTVAGIPTSYAYQQTFALTTGTNTIWGQGFSALRYVIGDSAEGNARNILVKNAIPFVSRNDPRLPVSVLSSLGQDGLTRVRRTALYGQLTAVDVVNGIDARLVEAEAALRAGNVTQFLAIHNALRAAPPLLGTVQAAALPPLADPGTQAGRIDLHFREKAFWTFSRGQRLGDMRRLVRQYGRAPTDVFPEGIHYKGGSYGTDVNLPIVTDERNNPNFQGCTNRNA